MLIFESNDLYNEICDSIKTLSFLDGNIAGIEFSDFKNLSLNKLKSRYYNDDDEKMCITLDSPVIIEIGEDDYPSIKLLDSCVHHALYRAQARGGLWIGVV